ncbi:MAG: VOC family protein [Micromonosporaceae bacterium]|nr:VOC family protein [Micromonosporaceae bacterium]
MALRTKTPWWGVVLDAPDVPALADFYARLLGWQVFNQDATWAALAPAKDAGYYIGIQHEPLYVRPVWPATEGHQQISMHLDIEVEDLASAVDYAISVGAELAQYQPQESVRVLLDPVGHPFCLYLDPDTV